MSSDLGKFKATITTFIDELLIWAQTLQDTEKERHINVVRRKLELALKIDPRSTTELFVSSVYPHAHYLLKGDDRYFLESDPAVLGIDPEMTELHHEVSSWWPVLSEQQKTVVKRYLKLLLLQGCIATKHEPTRLLINEFRAPNNPLLFN